MINKRIFVPPPQVLVPLSVLVVAVLAAVWFIKTKPAPRKKSVQPMASAVEAVTVMKKRHSVTITAMGTVSPVQEVALQPEVTGLVVWKHRNLVPGGIVHQGDILLHIDARNYEVAVKQQKAMLEKAEVEYQLELSRTEVAAEEWRMMNQGKQIDSRSRTLALREPQLRAAEVAVSAASNALAKAELDINRTRIAAPFNAVVIDEFVDIGQFVSSQTRLAQLAGTDAFRVEVFLPVRDLQWIKWPDNNGEKGPSTIVLHDIGMAKPIKFEGQVTRVLSSLDNAAKMARVLVRVEDPLQLAKASADRQRVKLFSGAYVKVLIDGLPLDDVIEVPDAVIREGNRVWVMNKKGLLEFRDIEVLRRQNGKALVQGNISGGEQVVSSHISTPIPGMKLKLKGQPTSGKGSGNAKSGKTGKKQK